MKLMRKCLSTLIYIVCAIMAGGGLPFVIFGGVLCVGSLYLAKLADYLSSSNTWDGEKL